MVVQSLAVSLFLNVPPFLAKEHDFCTEVAEKGKVSPPS